jgi:hypothetical protein
MLFFSCVIRYFKPFVQKHLTVEHDFLTMLRYINAMENQRSVLIYATLNTIWASFYWRIWVVPNHEANTRAVLPITTIYEIKKK